MPGCILWLVAANAVFADEWVDQYQLGRFYLRSQVPVNQNQSLTHFLSTLQDHESEVLSTLGLKPSTRPIVISVFASRRSYQRFIAGHAPEGSDRRALFVNAKTFGGVYAYVSPELLTDLRHETTHAILHATLPFLPLWMDEGLAEYFEVPRAARASQHPHHNPIKLAARFGLTWRPGLTRLESLQNLQEMSIKDYRESWAWVHFLLHGPDEATGLLKRYLAAIEAHSPPGPFSLHLRQFWPDYSRELKSHFRSWK